MNGACDVCAWATARPIPDSSSGSAWHLGWTPRGRRSEARASEGDERLLPLNVPRQHRSLWKNVCDLHVLPVSKRFQGDGGTDLQCPHGVEQLLLRIQRCAVDAGDNIAADEEFASPHRELKLAAAQSSLFRRRARF